MIYLISKLLSTLHVYLHHLHFFYFIIEQYLLVDVALVPNRLTKISLQVILFLHRVLLYFFSPNNAQVYVISFLLTIFHHYSVGW